MRDPHDRRPAAWGQAEALATAVGLDMAGTWSATAASYFSRVPKARVLEAVTEAVGQQEAGRIAGLRKCDMAEAAERLLESSGWLPPVLRVAQPGGGGSAGPGVEEPTAGTSGEAPGGSDGHDKDGGPIAVENGYAFAAG
ncbi:hypothetical protein D3C72_2067630 [compost metagenome]